MADKSSHELLGYIDDLGIFYVDYKSEGIELFSAALTEDIGFFDKLLFDSNLKDTCKNINRAFEIHKTIFKRVLKSTRQKRKRLLLSRILNWSYFENMSYGY